MHAQRAQGRRSTGFGFWRPLLAAVLCAPSVGEARTKASDEPTDGETVKMSEVTVEARRDAFTRLQIPKEAWDWRIGRMGQIEFLTSASDRATEAAVRELSEFTQLLEWMIPQWKRPAGRPLRLVLCGARDTFTELRPVAPEGNERDAVTAYYPGNDGAYIVVDLGVISLGILETHGLQRTGGFSTLNAGYGEGDDAAVTFDSDSADLPVETGDFLKRDYVRDLLSAQGWHSPAWFTEGMVQLVATTKVEDGKARIGRLPTSTITSMSEGRSTGTGQASELSLFFQGRAMKPLLQLFEVGYDAPEYLNPIGSTFSAQALGFVHYCLYGAKGRYQAPLLNWVTRLQTAAPTEEGFRDCFGVSSKAFNTALRGYFDGGRYHSPVTSAETLPALPECDIHPAEPAEIAVFKADVHRVAGRLDAAHTTLETALARGFVSAEVYDGLGAVALDRPDYAAARTAFAQAAKLGADSEAHRWGQFQVEVWGSDTLATEDAKRLMREAVQLRANSGVSAAVVTRAMAEIFLRSSVKPDAGFWRMLDESVGRHPSDTALRIAVLRLHAKLAQTTEARALLATGRARALPASDRAALDAAAAAVGL